jgi:hypothetical protein
MGLLLPALCLFCIQAGCTAKLYPIPDEADRITDPAVLVDRIVQRQGRIKTVSTEGRIDSRSKAGMLRGRITTLVSSERKVRFEAWTPTWDLVGSFVGDPETFIYFERGRKYCLYGNSTTATIDKVLPLGIDFEQYASTLIGTPPLKPEASWTIEFDRRCGCWLLTAVAPDGGVQKLRADADGTVRRSTWIAGGRTTMDVAFRDIESVSLPDGEIRFAKELSFENPGKKSSATLRFKDVEINGETEYTDWDQICPDGLDRAFIR